jgi:hypothetical protein
MHPVAVAAMSRPLARTLVVIFGLILSLLLSASFGLAQAAHAGAPQLKAVIIVGPTHEYTTNNLTDGEALAKVAESYGMDVRRVFHPKATWANVLANIQGANLVAYLGHGNGWPSPYGPYQENTKDGFGLNPYEGAAKTNVEYHGAKQIRASVVLAQNSIVLLNHLCYASGNAEEGMAIPGWNTAVERVDNFANGFIYSGAKAVFAYGRQRYGQLVKDLFTTNKTVEQMFKTAGAYPKAYYGYIGWDPRKFDSVRRPGSVNFLDPDPKDGFLRAVTGDLSLTATDWLSGASGSDGGSDLTPKLSVDTTPPSVPTGLATQSLSYRYVRLTWQASTDDSGGTIRYRIKRDGVLIGKTTDTTFLDRPTAGTHKYKVRAVDAAGNVSAFSPVVIGTALRGIVP